MDPVQWIDLKSSKRLIIFLVVLLSAIGLLILSLSAGIAEQRLGTNLLALIPAAFLSGLLSFLSPCSLPILPAYFAYSFQSNRRNIVIMTAAFFFGLATTMTLLGASLTVLGRLLLTNISLITIIGGYIIIILGGLSIFGKGFTGVQFQDTPAKSIGGSYLYGATFAIGWTACIGPILGAILTFLVTQGAGILQGAILTFVYTLGLGFPLIIVSTFFSRLGSGSPFWRFIRGKGVEFEIFNRKISIHSTGLFSGLLLIGMGILLLTGTLNEITQLALNSPISSWVIEIDEHIRLIFRIR